VNGAPRAVTAVAGTGATVTLTFDGAAVAAAADVKVEYIPPVTNRLVAAATGNAAVVYFVQNLTRVTTLAAPTVATATVPVGATNHIDIAFSAGTTLDTAMPSTSAFTVMVASSAAVQATVTSVVRLNNTTIRLNLSGPGTPLSAASVVSVSYEQPAANPLKNTDATGGALVASFGLTAVTNNFAAVPPPAGTDRRITLNRTITNTGVATIAYSIDNGTTWTNVTSWTNNTAIFDVPNNTVVQLRATPTTGHTVAWSGAITLAAVTGVQIRSLGTVDANRTVNFAIAGPAPVMREVNVTVWGQGTVRYRTGADAAAVATAGWTNLPQSGMFTIENGRFVQFEITPSNPADNGVITGDITLGSAVGTRTTTAVAVAADRNLTVQFGTAPFFTIEQIVSTKQAELRNVSGLFSTFINAVITAETAPSVPNAQAMLAAADTLWWAMHDVIVADENRNTTGLTGGAGVGTYTAYGTAMLDAHRLLGPTVSPANTASLADNAVAAIIILNGFNEATDEAETIAELAAAVNAFVAAVQAAPLSLTLEP
jgi:hypothetical protein